MDQHSAPLLAIAQDYLDVDHAAFYMPAHKRGQSIDRELLALLGDRLFFLDLPELPDLEEPIALAEELAADAYGSDRAWFLTNGSTCGVQAMLLASCGDGDRVLIGRNCHQAAIAGLILTGAIPIYLPCDYEQEFDLDLGVSPATLEKFLQKYPDAKAVMLVSPNYFGVCGDLEQMAAIAHAYNVPLLIDAAHGAHLGFHPELPISALQAGADLVVQSTHKMAGSLTQSAMLHLQGDRLDPERVDRALQILRSTSPNLALLISLDVARRQMATQGKQLLTETLRLADLGRSQITQIPQLQTFGTEQIPNLDPTRLTVIVKQLGITGFAADEYLQHLVMAEMPTLTQLVLALSIGNRESDIERLVNGLQKLSQLNNSQNSKIYPIPHHPLEVKFNPLAITPRQAHFAPRESVPIAQAIGRISAETLCPYPPGIPLICIGEEITLAAVAMLQEIKRSGGVINGASSEDCDRLLVLC